MAMHSNGARSQSRRKKAKGEKKHLITSNSCKPFWSPKVSQCLGRCVCSVSGNDLPSHEHCHVLQRRCPPAAPLNFSLTLSCLPCLRITASELMRSLSFSPSLFFIHLTLSLCLASRRSLSEPRSCSIAPLAQFLSPSRPSLAT